MYNYLKKNINKISLITFILFIFLFSNKLSFSAQPNRELTKQDIIKNIIQKQNIANDKKGIYVDGIGELWFAITTDGEFEFSDKRIPVKFKGTIKSPTDFSLKANLSLSELGSITNIFNELIIFLNADIELVPTGINLISELSFSKLLAPLSGILLKNFSMDTDVIKAVINVTDKITINCDLIEKFKLISDNSYGTELNAEKVLLKIVLDLKNKKISSAEMKAQLELKPSSHDTSIIKLSSRILIDLNKKSVIISAKSEGEIKSIFGITGADVKDFNLKYDSIKKIFEIDCNITGFSLSAFPFLDDNLKPFFSKFTIKNASFKYANQSGTIFDEKFEAGLTVKASADFNGTNVDLFFKKQPDIKGIYLETNIKNLSLYKLGILPQNMEKFLPDFNLETASLIYANKEQTIDNKKVKAGYQISGKIIIGLIPVIIKSYYEPESHFSLIDLTVTSASIKDFIPESLMSEEIQNLFSKIKLSRTNILYSNKTSVFDGKKVYSGIHITGKMQVGGSTGDFAFIYSDQDKIFSLNSNFSEISLSNISIFPSDVNKIISNIKLTNVHFDYVNKTGSLEGNQVKEGLNISGNIKLGNIKSRLDIMYSKEKDFFAMKSFIEKSSLRDIFLPGLKLEIPNEINEILKNIQSSKINVLYANKKGMFHDIEVEKGFQSSGEINLFGAKGKFKVINHPDDNLFYLYASLDKINPGKFSIIPLQIRAITEKYFVTNGELVYSSKNTTIDGKKVDQGLRLSGQGIINSIKANFLFFYNKDQDFFYIKSIFPQTTLYDINNSLIPVKLPEAITDFAKNVGAKNVTFEYANKSGKIALENISGGMKASGKMNIYSTTGDFNFIYDTDKKFYFLKLDINKVNLGSFPLMPEEVKKIASKITFSKLSFLYSNQTRTVDGKKIYQGFDLSGDAQVGNSNSNYRIQYDTDKKAVLINTHISRASLNDINIFSESAWMPDEIKDFSGKCVVQNADIIISNYTGDFRGAKVQKGLKVKGIIEIFSKKADFEIDYLSDNQLYYFNTTLNEISLNDIDIFKSVSSLPEGMRNFGKNIIIKKSTFTYSNKTGLIGEKKVNEGLSITGEMSSGNMTGMIDFKYSSLNQVFGLGLTLNKITLSEVNILSWFVDIPSNVKKITDKIILENLNLNYANKTGVAAGQKFTEGFRLIAKAEVFDTKVDFTFYNFPSKKAYYLKLGVKDFSLYNLGIMPENMKIYLPDFKVENGNFIYANKEQTIDDKKVKPGYEVNGKIKIGSIPVIIKSYYEPESHFALIDLTVTSASINDFIPDAIMSEEIKNLFSKIKLSNTNVLYSNKTSVFDGKKVYSGINITGKMQVGGSTGDFAFIYSDKDKIFSLNSNFSEISLSNISIFPSDVNRIISNIKLTNVHFDFINKSGTLEGKSVKEGLNISGNFHTGNINIRLDLIYSKEKEFFAMKSLIDKVSFKDLSLPGIKLEIPAQIKDFFANIQSSNIEIMYANKKGMFHDKEVEKGLQATGKLDLFGAKGKFKVINHPDDNLFYLYTSLDKINQGKMSIIPSQIKSIVEKYFLTNAEMVYSSKKTTIDGNNVDEGLKLSGNAQINSISSKFLFFYNKSKDFFYTKTVFPHTTLYDINNSIIPVKLPDVITDFAKNLGTDDVIFEYANKTGNVGGENIQSGMRASGKMHAYSTRGDFRFIYNKDKKFYYLKMDIDRINLGSLSFLPEDVKKLASKFTFSKLAFVYANQDGNVDGKKVYQGFDFSGDAKVGNINSHYQIQYDTQKKAVLINTHIVHASLDDINIFSEASWMPNEIKDFSRKSSIDNTDITFSNYTGTFRGNTVQKGLKVKGVINIFSKKADFEIDYLSDNQLYYFNTTVHEVSLYDVNIFRAVPSLPGEMRNFGKNIIIKKSTFTYSNKSGLVGNTKVYEGLAISGEIAVGSKSGTIDFKYSTQSQVFGIGLTIGKITLSDVNILSWFIDVPSDVKKITDKISLENINLTYANKTGDAAGKKFTEGVTFYAKAVAFNKSGDFTFYNSPSNKTYYFELKLGRITLNDINIFKEFMKMPDAISKIGNAIALKDFVFGYANNAGKIGGKAFVKGINVFGTPDLSGIPGFKVLLNSLHINDLKISYLPDAGINFDAKIRFNGKLNNFLAKFLKLKLPDLDLRIGFSGQNLHFDITLMKFGNHAVNINPLLGTQIKIERITLKIELPINGGMPAFEFNMAMLVKPSKWDKFLHFVPAIKFNPVTQSLGFAATMKDTWVHPFGIKVGDILIQNVAFEIMLNLESGIPTTLGFVGERLRFFGGNYGFLFLVSAEKETVALGLKVDKFYLTNIPVLSFLPTGFLKNSVYLKNVDIHIAPNGGSVGEIQIKPGITVKGEAKLGPMNGFIDLNTGSLGSFKGYFKGQVNTGLNEIEHFVLEKVKKVPFIRPLLKKVLDTFGVDYIKFDFDASVTKVSAKIGLGIKLMGKHYNLKLDVEFSPLKLALKIVKQIEHFLKDELLKIWNALKNGIVKDAKIVAKAAVKAYNSVKSWITNNIGPFISSVSDYIKKIAYTAFRSVKKFFGRKKDWYKPWKWRWKDIYKIVKEAYTAFRYEPHTYSFDDRMAKLKEYAGKIIKQSTESSIQSINKYFEQILPKITDFDGNDLKKIIDETFQTLLDDISDHWMSIYNDNQVQNFFNNSGETLKGLTEYKQIINTEFSNIKAKTIELFQKTFSNKEAVLKLINEKSEKIWFNKFKITVKKAA